MNILSQTRPSSNTPPSCPDLEWLCRGVYRTGHDPAATPGGRDPWLVTLAGRFGTIYVHGRDALGVEVVDARVASRVAAALGNAVPYTRGWHHWCYLFGIDKLGAIAEIVRPPRNRRLSAAARRRLIRVGSSTRFEAADAALGSLSEPQGGPERPEATPGPPGPAGAAAGPANHSANAE
jgi:hypothetical protein